MVLAIRLTVQSFILRAAYSVEAAPPDPMDREIISDVLPLGVKAVDGLLTVGKGQRIGIFAGSGVGKKYTAWYVCKKYKGRY